MEPFVPDPRPTGDPVGYPMLIDGDDVEGQGERRPVVDPYTGSAWATVPQASDEEVRLAVAAARRAFDEGPWSRMAPSERSRLLRGLARLLADHAPELTRLQVMENGKAIREQYAQTAGLAKHVEFFAALAQTVGGQIMPLESDTTLNYTVRVPVGVVAALTPWNSPLSLLMWKFAPALAAGNTLVVKPSEVTPVSTIRFVQLCREAGLPEGVVNVVTGDGAVGASLVDAPGVDKVAFTGSTAVGRKIASSAGERLVRYSLELGGKSPNIVFADADLPAALEGVVGGIFAAAGQTCIAGSRILVQQDIHDEFIDRFAARARSIRLGDPLSWETEVGTIACAPQYQKVLDYIEIAQREGARLVAGGGAPDALGSGLFIEPTVFDQVDNSMRVATEEIFGPVASVIAFEDEEEAMAIANASEFGLAAGVWTTDLGRANRCARRLQCGTVWINTYRRTHHASPFGGFKQSGIGRENGPGALEEFTEVKSVWIDMGGGMKDPFNPFA